MAHNAPRSSSQQAPAAPFPISLGEMNTLREQNDTVLVFRPVFSSVDNVSLIKKIGEKLVGQNMGDFSPFLMRENLCMVEHKWFFETFPRSVYHT